MVGDANRGHSTPTYDLAMSSVGRAVALGMVAGFVGGLFGVGGGLLMVPGMVLFMGISQHTAHGTSVAAIVASASAAVSAFAVRSEVDWDTAGFILIGSVIGAYFGARLIARIPAVWLARAFVGLTVVAAVRMGLVS